MINEKVFEEMALMVTRQTELSLEEAKNKLKEKVNSCKLLPPKDLRRAGRRKSP